MQRAVRAGRFLSGSGSMARNVQATPAPSQPVESVDAAPGAVNVDRAPIADRQRSRSSVSRPYQHGKNAPTARLTSSATMSISKAQEFAFIRNDLRRLLVTAGILVVIMIALLVVIDR